MADLSQGNIFPNEKSNKYIIFSDLITRKLFYQDTISMQKLHLYILK